MTDPVLIHQTLRGAGIASEPRQEPSGCAKGSSLLAVAPAPRKTIDGIDDSDQPIHIRIEGTTLAYCGVSLAQRAGYIPEEEVTPTAWCAACEHNWEIR